MTDMFPTAPSRALPPRLSPKQAKVMRYLQEHDTITLSIAVDLIGGNLYCNEAKHVGVTLSTMVKRGLIERVKPGLFRLPKKP